LRKSVFKRLICCFFFIFFFKIVYFEIFKESDDKTDSTCDLRINSTIGEIKSSYPIEEFLKLQDDLVKAVEINKNERPFLHVVDFKNVAQFPVNKINCFTQT
jgi:hypothetical protein